MHKTIFHILRVNKILWILLALWLNVSIAAEIPNLQGRVNDYANILSNDTIILLESQLEQIEKNPQRKIIVLTVPSLTSATIEEFSF